MIKPYYEEPNITIYNGDCLEIITQLRDESIDMVITDPPYNKGKDYIGAPGTDNKSVNEFWDFNKIWLEKCFGILKEGHHLYFSCSSDQIWDYKNIINESNYKYRHLLIWATNEVKGHMGPNNWLRSYEPIFWLQKGDKTYGLFNNYPFNAFDVLIFRSPHFNSRLDKKFHLAQKPLNLFKTIINKSIKKDDIVLDPFLGSGTTTRACKDLGRKCIGIEISESYCQIAVKRLAQEVLNFND